MSIIVLNALADSLSVGDMKFPAALFITTLGKPTYNIIEIKLGSVFSAASDYQRLKVIYYILKKLPFQHMSLL